MKRYRAEAPLYLSEDADSGSWWDDSCSHLVSVLDTRSARSKKTHQTLMFETSRLSLQTAENAV